MSADLRDIVGEMIEALELETDAVRARGRTRSIRVSRGRHVALRAGRHTYSFRLPKDTGPVEATSVAVVAAGMTQTGELLDVNGRDAIVSVPRDLGKTVSSATLEIDPAAVLEATSVALMACRDAMAGLHTDSIAELLGLTPPHAATHVEPAASDLDPHQAGAVGTAMSRNLAFVWGPPGTGKTRTLGALAAELCRRGARVLVAAHAHVAVDTALLAALRAGASPVVRIGVPQLPEVPDDTVVDGWGSLPRPGAGGYVAATTLAKIAVSGLVEDDGTRVDFDHVLVDETSMVHVPQLVLAAVLAPRLTLFGDFRQLPPIVTSAARAARAWLGTDAFEVAGMTRAVQADTHDPRLTMLRRQYRAHPTVAAVCNRFAYGGRLESADSTADLTRLAPASPLPGAAVVVWDTASLGAVSLRPAVSRCNPTSALLVARAAAEAARDHAALSGGERLIGIATPYAEQARLIRLLLEDSGRGEDVEIATVHRFQGGERELMFVDLCDTRPLSPPPFLGGDEGLRLLNVAMSRARSKLVVVADLTWLTRGVVGDAIRIAGEEGESVAAEAWDGLDWHDVESFLEAVCGDVANAKEVLVRAPRLRHSALTDAVVSMARRGDACVVTDARADPDVLDTLRGAGATVEVHAGVPERVVVADGMTWVGNTVSAAAARSGRAMVRQDAPTFARRLLRILGPREG
ncbi:MAG: AAA family ATPase [Acidimicrobiia bacterium]|nr:AAA family ATPase [Acidimicrobiia bacterium]